MNKNDMTLAILKISLDSFPAFEASIKTEELIERAKKLRDALFEFDDDHDHER